MLRCVRSQWLLAARHCFACILSSLPELEELEIWWNILSWADMSLWQVGDPTLPEVPAFTVRGHWMPAAYGAPSIAHRIWAAAALHARSCRLCTA